MGWIRTTCRIFGRFIPECKYHEGKKRRAILCAARLKSQVSKIILSANSHPDINAGKVNVRTLYTARWKSRGDRARSAYFSPLYGRNSESCYGSVGHPRWGSGFPNNEWNFFLDSVLWLWVCFTKCFGNFSRHRAASSRLQLLRSPDCQITPYLYRNHRRWTLWFRGFL